MAASKKLFLIDGHAQIYAAYYAPMGSNLTARSGEPTKAVYIFTTMMLKLLKEQKPDFLAVAMDSIGPTFRHAMYPAYKANRQEIPEDLPRQIERIEQILRAMRIPILRLNGYEADDLIGTLSSLAGKHGLQTVICSKDKDLEQLISSEVSMMNLQTGEITDSDGLEKKKGIRPHQVVDVLALAGDTSDNIPGVPDVGPKTALQWIQAYQTLDNLIAHADQIKGKRGDNLRASLDQLDLTRKLVTIDCRVPLTVDWNQLQIQPFDTQAIGGILEELGVRKLLPQNQDTPDAMPEPPGLFSSPQPRDPQTPLPAAPKHQIYHLVDTPESLAQFYQELSRQSFFAIDTETTSVHPVWAELVGLSFSWQSGTGYYLPLKAPLGQKCLDRQTVLNLLRPILTSPDIRKTGQNIKYDAIVLKRAGIDLRGIAFDTMVASYVLDSARNQHNLDSLARDFLGHETIKLHDLIGKGKQQKTFDWVDTRLAADYSAEDADITWRLTELFQSRLSDPDLRRLYEQVELPLVEVLGRMEYNGVAIDVPVLNKLGNTMSARLEELNEEIQKEAGRRFNVDSPKQLAQVLFEHIGLNPVKKTKTGTSTDQEVLEALRWQHPVPALMLEYRQLSKLKNTYVDTLPQMICPSTGRIHASFNQTVTATGRLSSSDPNLQNIPIRSSLGQEIRRAFVAGGKNRVLIAADYSQIELRILAHLSQDPGLRQAFEAGQDIHRFVASQVYNIPIDQVDPKQRSSAKAVNFGIIYGQTAYGLSRAIGIPVDQAQRFIDGYFLRYPSIQKFIDSVIAQAAEKGYVSTLLGRRRAVPEIRSQNKTVRKLAERMAVNTVVQGSAADLIKVAMIRLHRRIDRESLPLSMILQVHDELVFEADLSHAQLAAEIVRDEMQSAIPMNIAIIAETGINYNWLECK